MWVSFGLVLGVLGVLKGAEGGVGDRRKELAVATAFDATGAGKNLSLNDEPELMFDLSRAASKGIQSIGQICSQGTWLIYDATDFVAKSKKEVGVLSGDKVCGSVKEYGKILSLQSVTSHNDRNGNTIALFPDKDFGGRVHSIDSSKLSNPGAPPAQSLITVGKQEWALYPDMGSPVCISPQGSDKFPICFISKLIDGDQILSGKFVDVQRGCNEELRKNRTIPVHFCTSYESKKILRIDDIGAKLQGRAFKKPGSGAGKSVKPVKQCETDGTLDADGLKLIKLRIAENFTSDENLLWPKDKSRVWLLELLERSFHVLFATCPGELVSTEYEKMVREIFIFQWDLALNRPELKKNLSKSAIDEERYYYVNRLLEECFTQTANSHDLTNAIVGPTIEAFKGLTETDDWKESLDPIFHMRESNDHVIETVWLIANHVAATCHHAMNFVVNFWADFIEMFNQIYLSVVEKAWKEPGNWNTAYKYVLGGYDIKRTYNKLALCATSSHNLIVNLDPFHRTYDAKLKK